MKVKQLREQDDKQLRERLITIRRKQLDLRVQAKMGSQPVKTHRFAELRREAARIKTLLNQRQQTTDK